MCFTFRFLANEMEEETNFHAVIYPWGLGDEFLVKWQEMRSKKLEWWERMGFKAWVNRSSCEEAMEDNPTLWAWRRKRHHNHGLAIRLHARQRDYYYFNVPDISPAICSQCASKPPLPKKVRPDKVNYNYVLPMGRASRGQGVPEVGAFRNLKVNFRGYIEDRGLSLGGLRCVWGIMSVVGSRVCLGFFF
ncbi:speedy protein 1-B-like isoform X1 [Xenopus laevis]|uniref:Speedy protein 1-B-like isoform X1 n=1 Tax=Xenopus laevis TaxID=8355 RepID=A0A8J1KQU2_XENLA|nr:speedy protein 1-B-like isoform X1 [Xenopus laevis]